MCWPTGLELFGSRDVEKVCERSCLVLTSEPPPFHNVSLQGGYMAKSPLGILFLFFSNTSTFSLHFSYVILGIYTPLKTNMTSENHGKSIFSIGKTSSNGGCFIVMLVFGGGFLFFFLNYPKNSEASRSSRSSE